MQLTSALSEVLRVSSLLLVFSTEILFIAQKREPIYHALPFSCFLLFFILKTYLSRPSQVYLVDFSCFRPPNSWRVPFSTYLEHARMFNIFDEESLSFMARMLTSSGQSENTYLPPALHYIPPRSTDQESIDEFQMVAFPVFEDLMSKTNLSPRDIDILIVNSSVICPSPSLSSIIINKYALRDDVKSFNLSGMGCSASAICIDIAQNILKTLKNSNAVIISTEILSTGWYSGKERPMLILNCSFRTGSAAILLTNKREEKKIPKYVLLRSLRTQRAYNDLAYNSAMREEDSNGLIGFALKKDLMKAVGETLMSNFTILGSLTFPFTEKIRYAVSIIWKRFFDKSAEVYIPSFRSIIQHFCLPTSGKTLIGEIGKGLKLGEKDVEAALMTLHRFGNQSSSSLWYELAYMEGKERVKKGDKVWMLGFGSGLKCTSLVWKCVGHIVGEAQRGPWADSIDSYPVLSVDQRDS
ncbi:hypothetical protein RJ639_047013 [Escallonia herrerae]|uniref:3-ketoacyl-CoA synthase n=1 Tax=Escallonia herrerae TaxID=1293975 RepID=A0AA88W6W5_9ASTE|nr:hypothetical protein RJ639_047013 [Escallonia herrerae]